MNILAKFIKIIRLSKIKYEILKKNKKNQKIMLNIGCGSDIREDWINIDDISNEFLNHNITKKQRKNIFKYDCSGGLKLKENSVDFIYSSHFLEHLPPGQASKIIKHSYKSLKHSGVFRIALPLVVPLIKKICNGEFSQKDKDELTLVRTMFRLDGYENDIDYLNYIIYQYYEHKYIYTPDKVIQILKWAGFKNVREVDFDYKYDINSELRTKNSFYVEGIKE